VTPRRDVRSGTGSNSRRELWREQADLAGVNYTECRCRPQSRRGIPALHHPVEMLRPLRGNRSPGRRASRGPSSDFRRTLAGRVRSGQSPGKFLNSLLLPRLTREGGIRPTVVLDRRGETQDRHRALTDRCRAQGQGGGVSSKTGEQPHGQIHRAEATPSPPRKPQRATVLLAIQRAFLPAGLFCVGTKLEREPEPGSGAPRSNRNALKHGR
jgi:hypothetical protein